MTSLLLEGSRLEDTGNGTVALAMSSSTLLPVHRRWYMLLIPIAVRCYLSTAPIHGSAHYPIPGAPEIPVTGHTIWEWDGSTTTWTNRMPVPSRPAPLGH